MKPTVDRYLPTLAMAQKIRAHASSRIKILGSGLYFVKFNMVKNITSCWLGDWKQEILLYWPKTRVVGFCEQCHKILGLEKVIVMSVIAAI